MIINIYFVFYLFYFFSAIAGGVVEKREEKQYVCVHENSRANKLQTWRCAVESYHSYEGIID